MGEGEEDETAEEQWGEEEYAEEEAYAVSGVMMPLLISQL